MRYTLFIYIVLAVSILSLTACRHRPLYYHYEDTPAGGWDRTDTLHFTVPAMTDDGRYSIQLGLCTDNGYPYRNLSIVVQHTVLPSRQVRNDTIYCDVIDEAGHPLGDGISRYQYLLSLTSLSLKKGESLQFSIYHNMRREILPHVSSVGVLVDKEIPI